MEPVKMYQYYKARTGSLLRELNIYQTDTEVPEHKKMNYVKFCNQSRT
jgi:hypothetical protein